MKKTACLIMGVFLFSVLPYAVHAGTQNAEIYLERGMRYYQVFNLSLAIGEFEKGFAAANSAKDRRSQEALASALGSAFIDQANYRKAVYYYGEALNYAELLKDKKRVTDDLIALGTVHDLLDNHPKALSYYEDALKIARQRRDNSARSVALLRMAEAYIKLGLKQKAHSCLAGALALSTATGKQKDIGSALFALGDLYRAFGEQSRAVAYYESALQVGRQARDPKLAGASLSSIGGIEYERGNCDRALSCLKEAVNLSREARNPKRTAENLAELGRVYRRYGDLQDAQISAGAALEIARRLGDAHFISICLEDLGDIYESGGDYSKTLAQYAQALATRQEAGLPTDALRRRIADCHFAMGQFDTAEEGYVAVPDPLRLGRVNLAQKNYQKAIEHFYKVFEGRPETRDDRAAFAAYTGIGHALAALGDLRSAVTNYVKAVTLLEAREQAALKADEMVFSAGPIEGFPAADAYEGLIHSLARLGSADEAFFYAEDLRLRVFARAVLGRQFDKESRGIPPDMAQEEDSNLIHINAVKKELSSARRFGMVYNLDAKEQELQAAEEKQRRLVDRLRKLYPAYASIRYPRPLRAKDQNLRDNETLLELAATEEATYVFLVNGKNRKLKLRRVPFGRDKIRALIAEYMAAVRKDVGAGPADGTAAAGRRLFDELFGSLLDGVVPGAALTIVPDETFGSLPFEALSVEDQQPGGAEGSAARMRYMGERWHIAYAQSATWLSMLREREKYGEPEDEVLMADGGTAPAAVKNDAPNPEIFGTIAVWAGADGNAGRDPRVAAESVLQGFPGMPEITDALRSDYGEKAVALQGSSERGIDDITFSRYHSILWCGRAFLDVNVPYVRQPFLILPAGIVDGRAGRMLTMSRIVGLAVPAETVVLPRADAGGSGALAMARAFQLAGCDSVVLSRWRVPADTTVIFCDALYRGLASGAKAADALDAARKAVRAKGYEHPYYWAGYMIAGR